MRLFTSLTRSESLFPLHHGVSCAPKTSQHMGLLQRRYVMHGNGFARRSAQWVVDRFNRSGTHDLGVFLLRGSRLASPQMSALATTAVVPLVTDSHGGIRVHGTRVALDRIVVAFK